MIGLISVNHHSTGVDERSLFSLSGAEASMLVEDWIACGLLAGAVVLSTCNRVEIYYDADTLCLASVERKLIESFLQNLELSPRYAHYIETKRNEDAYRHLFRVASGLESMVVGETQILGQLKEAYRMASISGHCPGGLSRLFHRAFEVAKRIRSEYLITATPLSAGSAAVDRLLEIKPNPNRILVIGAGVMSDTIYEHLCHHGHREIHVYNRTRERAEKFAEQHPNARVSCEGALADEVRRSDAIIVATSAATPILRPEHLDEHLGKRVLVDLAVPRNIDADVAALPYVQLISIDDLTKLGADLEPAKLEEIAIIIDEYVAIHKHWVEGAGLREVIATIQQASSILLEKELSNLPNNLSEDELTLVKHWDEHLRTTFSTAIVATLREISEEGQKRKYTDVMQTVFKHIISKHS